MPLIEAYSESCLEVGNSRKSVWPPSSTGVYLAYRITWVKPKVAGSQHLATPKQRQR